MAHYAELDANNIVLRVVVINDADTHDTNGVESEDVGIAFCKRLWGENTNWKKTSYNTYAGVHAGGKAQFRKNYAGIGFKYDPQRDAFIPPKPECLPEEESLISLDEDKCIWIDNRPPKQEATTGVTRV
jgi:hypothetical protein